MSTKDNKTGDAEFDAFLQHEGELAAWLQTLPQPAPSAALDAAILADAEAALMRQPMAANDAHIPQAGRRPSFIARWKIPLGLAASVLLALPLALRLWNAPASQDAAIVIAAAPAVSEPAPPLAAQDTQVSAAPDRSKAEQAAAPMPPVVARSVARKEPAHPRADQPVSTENRSEPPTVLAQAEIPELKSGTIAAAPSPQAAPAPATVARSAAAATDAPRAEADQPKLAGVLRARSAPAAPIVAESTANAVAEKADSGHAKAEQALPPLAQSSSAAAAPAIPAAAPPAPAGIAGAAVATGQAAPLLADLQKDKAATEAPTSWLARIDKQIKAGRQKEALEEWTRFRQMYPNYSVPKPLLKQIDDLKK